MSIRIIDLAAESYEQFGARLFHLCRTQFKAHTPINVAIAFADRDQGTGNAALWLTKHFGIFPVEIGRHDGEVNRQELARVMQKPGLTLLVQGLPLPDPRSRKSRTDSPLPSPDETDLRRNGNIHNHLPVLEGLKDKEARTLVQQLSRQISENSRFLTEASAHNAKPVVYVAGFNVVGPTMHSNSLPFVDILPWYLLICDGQGNTRIYKQPQLDRFLLKLPADNPDLIDLEAMIDDMASEPGDD